MPYTYQKADGSTIAWTGLQVCVCTKCDESFTTIKAFDSHLKGKVNRRKHDSSHLTRGKRGHLGFADIVDN